MKLRNKKTGKVGWLELYYDDDEAWVKQNLGDIDLNEMELPGFFTDELKGEEEE